LELSLTLSLKVNDPLLSEPERLEERRRVEL